MTTANSEAMTAHALDVPRRSVRQTRTGLLTATPLCAILCTSVESGLITRSRKLATDHMLLNRIALYLIRFVGRCMVTFRGDSLSAKAAQRPTKRIIRFPKMTGLSDSNITQALTI